MQLTNRLVRLVDCLEVLQAKMLVPSIALLRAFVFQQSGQEVETLLLRQVFVLREVLCQNQVFVKRPLILKALFGLCQIFIVFRSRIIEMVSRRLLLVGHVIVDCLLNLRLVCEPEKHLHRQERILMAHRDE